jgi:hypothetical protein
VLLWFFDKKQFKRVDIGLQVFVRVLPVPNGTMQREADALRCSSITESNRPMLESGVRHFLFRQ